MAIATVTADNQRLVDADAVSVSWTSPGGGAGAVTEPDVYFQRTGATGGAVSRKISAASRGIYYTNGTAIDMTNPSRSHVLFKVNITNYAAAPTIAAGGISIWAGTNDTNNYGNVLLGKDKYPLKGGWVLMPFSPRSAWATSVGTPPATSSISSFGIQVNAAFDAVSKAENVVIDAIDIGRGLQLTGGTGADAPCNFGNFVTFDQGTLSNRFGYVTENDNIISVFGRLGIGVSLNQQDVPTRFNDSGRILVFPDGLFENGFSGIDIHCGTGSTSSQIYMENITFIGISTGGGVVDTRPDLILEGNVGYTTIFNSRFTRFHEIKEVQTDVKCDILDCVFDDIELYNHQAGYIDGCTFNITANNPNGNGMMTCRGNAARVSNSLFKCLGSTGHAIDFKTPGTYNMVGVKYEGFSGTPGSNLVVNSGSLNASIVNSSGGLVTINVSGGGDQPSVRNTGAGSTTIVNANVTVNINGLPNTVGTANSTEIRVYDRSQINPTLGFSTSEFAGVGTENHRTETYTFSVGVGATFDVRIVNLDYVPLFIQNQSANTDPTNIPVDLKLDRVYSDDTPPSGE